MSSHRRIKRAKARDAVEIGKRMEWIPKAFEAAIFQTADNDAFEYEAMFKRFNATWIEMASEWNRTHPTRTIIDPRWFWNTYSKEGAIAKAKAA